MSAVRLDLFCPRGVRSGLAFGLPQFRALGAFERRLCILAHLADAAAVAAHEIGLRFAKLTGGAVTAFAFDLAAALVPGSAA